MVKKSTLFVCRISHENSNSSLSIAGDLVQREIINDCEKLYSNNNFYFLAMEPQPIWPKGNLFCKSKIEKGGKFINYINLPVLKNLIFMVFIFIYSLKYKNIIQYNSYFFENIAILFSGIFVKNNKIIILQDYRVGGDFSKLAIFYDVISNKLLRFFDTIIPVSDALAIKLNIFHKSIIFKGGITTYGYEFCSKNLNDFDEKIAVFAGALEKHNGIDKLIDFWTSHNIKIPLHVFGRGRLSDYVLKNSNNINIFYHGFSSQEVVSKWQERAFVNFCLRYSEGLNEEFFFPSKFFNLCCCPGILVFNNFKNLPDFFINDSIGLLSNDWVNLLTLLNLKPNSIEMISEVRKRKDFILENHTWYAILKKVLDNSKIGV